MTPTQWSRVLLLTTALLAASSPAAAQLSPLPQIDRSTLKAAQVIEDVPCGAGPLWRFSDDGRLHRCSLDRDATVRGVALPKGTSVTFNANGTHRVVFLPRTFTIDGHACRGSADNFMTELFPDGRLRTCWMPDDAVIQSIPCAAFSMWSDVVRRNPSGVRFHQNGMLASCRLSKDVMLNGSKLKKSDRIQLDGTGHLVAGANSPYNPPQGAPG